MLVGVPKEIKVHEYRVGLTPAGVRELIAHGHQVMIETRAGAAIGFADEQYLAAGARVVESAAEIFATAAMVIKVKEPGVIAGLKVAGQVFSRMNPDIEYKPCVMDGASVAPGDIVRPGVLIRVLPRAGHMVQVEAADGFNELVADFLRR